MTLVKRKNIKQMVAANKVCYGLNVQIGDPIVAELAGVAGFDFLRIDACHFSFSTNLIAHFVRTADSVGLPIIVRVDDINRAPILLNLGVAGIMVQRVQSATQAQEIVDLCKYSPLGERDMFSLSRDMSYDEVNFVKGIEEANDETLIVVQIEDEKGIENMEEILNVKGLDFVCSGRGDISQALSVPGQKMHPKVIDTENRILECARKAGLGFQLSAGTMEETQSFIDRGARVLTIANDLMFLKKSLKEVVQSRRTLL